MRTKTKWMSLEKATILVRNLGFTEVEQFEKFVHSEERPANLPRRPDVVYKGTEWRGLYDFLGLKKNIHGKVKRKWRPFMAAREWARSLGFKNGKEWRAYMEIHELPKDIPSNPDTIYAKDGWIGIRDWLFRPMNTYLEAKEIIRALGVQGPRSYDRLYKAGKLPEDLPNSPEEYYSYKDRGWVSWFDFTGFEKENLSKHLPYEEAREIARALGISATEYLRRGKARTLPKELPLNPQNVYRLLGVWKGWQDYVGTLRIQIHGRSFEKTRQRARQVCFDNLIIDQTTYSQKLKELKLQGEDIGGLKAPSRIFPKEWKGWNDWKGVQETTEEIVRLVRLLGVTSNQDWEKRRAEKRVDSRIAYPLYWYAKRGYKGKTLFGDSWEVFQNKKVVIDYADALPLAQKFAQENHIRTPGKWKELVKEKKPHGLVQKPQFIYKGKGWESWVIWFGLPKLDLTKVDISQVRMLQVDSKDNVVRIEQEVWKPLSLMSGFECCEEYHVSTHGRVHSCYDGILESHPIGHRTIHLAVYIRGIKRSTQMIHRLVALAFIPNPENKPLVNHIDSNPQNNHVGNLEWVTSRENNYHAILSGSKKSALSVEVVATIKELLSQGHTFGDIATHMGVTSQVVRGINLGYTYKWIGVGRYTYPIQGEKRKFHLTNEQKTTIHEMHKQGFSIREIAKKVDLCVATIYHFVHDEAKDRESMPYVNLSAIKVCSVVT